jgi:two-component system response regulator YesN
MKDGASAYTVMIVEDELLVRVGLNVTVPWADFGMKVVAVEEEGVSAWESYQSLLPNVVITDIRMPGMDGVELIRRIREKGEPCVIIVITCLEEFDILYQLMKMDITGYLIKATLVQKDVTELLKKATQKLQEDGISANHSPHSSGAIDNPLYDFIFHHHDSKSYISACEETGQPVELPQFCILIHWNNQIQEILKSTIINIFQKRLQLMGKIEVLSEDEFLFITLTKPIQSSIINLHSTVKELSFYVNDALNVELRIVICETEGNIEKLAIFTRQGKNIAQNPYFYPDSIIICEVDASDLCVEMNLLDRIILLREKVLVKVPPLVYQKNKLLFATLFDALQESIGPNKQQFEQSLLSLVKLYLSCKEHKEESKGLLESFQSSIIKAKNAFDALYDLEKAIFSFPSSLHPIYGKQMLYTMGFIREHLDENISLTDLASIINISPNYYSSLFRQMLGCCFSEYLGLIRIDKACDLMAASTSSIQEISALCGFSDATYFSRFFKQKVGTTPYQWRMKK